MKRSLGETRQDTDAEFHGDRIGFRRHDCLAPFMTMPKSVLQREEPFKIWHASFATIQAGLVCDCEPDRQMYSALSWQRQFRPTMRTVFLFDDGQNARLVANIVVSISGTPDFIIERQLEFFRQADPGLGAGINAALDTIDPQF